MPSHRHIGPRGFTLIDMAIALTVMSILAAVIIPGTMTQARNRMGEATVRQVFTIFDAAKWYSFYSGEAPPGSGWDPTFKMKLIPPIWPGQDVEPTGIDYVCLENFNATDAKDQLLEWDLLVGSRAFLNPWEEPYALSLDGPTASAIKVDPNLRYNCWFTITTAVPEDVVPVFVSYLPNAHCTQERADACPSNVTAPEGFVRCCASIPPPGKEVKFREWMRGYENSDFYKYYCSPFADEWPGVNVYCDDHTL